MKDISHKRNIPIHKIERPQSILSENISFTTIQTKQSQRRIKHINECLIAKTFIQNEQSKKTQQYHISQLLETKKYNELVYVKCSFSDVTIQQDCILSFKMHDLNDENIFILGKYWSKCKTSELLHQSSCLVLGKLKHSSHSSSSSSLISSSIHHKKKDYSLIFECIWISLGKENEL